MIKNKIAPFSEKRDGYFIIPVIAGINRRGRKANKKLDPSSIIFTGITLHSNRIKSNKRPMILPGIGRCEI